MSVHGVDEEEKHVGAIERSGRRIRSWAARPRLSWYVGRRLSTSVWKRRVVTHHHDPTQTPIQDMVLRIVSQADLCEDSTDDLVWARVEVLRRGHRLG